MLPERRFDDYVQPSPQPEKPSLRVIPGGGLELFTCPNQPGNLRLSKQSCKDQFIRASKSNLGERTHLAICAQCKIGKINSGLKAAPLLPTVCVRCKRGSGRHLIGKLLCINCSNRMQEYVKQKNGRGKLPVRYKTLYLFTYDKSLTVLGRDSDEAQRVVEAMTGKFKANLLINNGKSSPHDVGDWWHDVILPWSAKRTKRIRMKL